MIIAGSSLSTGNEYYTIESTSSSGEVRYRAMAKETLPTGLYGTWAFSGEVLIPEGTSGVPLTRSQIETDTSPVWTDDYRNGERLINATKGIWTKFVHIFDIPKGYRSLHIGIKFANGTQEVGDKIHFKNFKLERGNVATDWTPSPEDIQGKFLEVVNHGTTDNVARPVGAISVLWVGTVEPQNAVDNDIWIGG